jgi:hypothetical protein
MPASLHHRARVGVGVLERQHLRPHLALQPFPDRIEHLALVVFSERRLGVVPGHEGSPSYLP